MGAVQNAALSKISYKSDGIYVPSFDLGTSVGETRDRLVILLNVRKNRCIPFSRSN
jgi:hypothetical protein